MTLVQFTRLVLPYAYLHVKQKGGYFTSEMTIASASPKPDIAEWLGQGIRKTLTNPFIAFPSRKESQFSGLLLLTEGSGGPAPFLVERSEVDRFYP